MGLNWDKCPICESKLIEVEKETMSDLRVVICINSCFKYTNAIFYYSVAFFNDENPKNVFRKTQSEINKKIFIKEIEDKIAYWKKDDRYLMEILSK